MGANDAAEQLEAAKAECVRLERALAEAVEANRALTYEAADAIQHARTFVVGECLEALNNIAHHRTGWIDRRTWLDPFEAKHAVFHVMSRRAGDNPANARP